MDKLKITFNISTPLYLNTFIMLDSLLLYHFLKCKGINEDALNVINDEKIMNDFPIEKVYLDPEKLDWYYNCSAGIYTAIDEFKSSIKKRISYPEVEFMHGNIIINSGFFKAHDIKFLAMVVDSIDFYCTGNYEGVMDLCDDIYAIGKKRNRGYGKVKSCIVQKVEQNISNHLKKRPIPITDQANIKQQKPDQYISKMTYRPPYWDFSNAKLCKIEGFFQRKTYIIETDLFKTREKRSV